MNGMSPTPLLGNGDSAYPLLGSSPMQAALIVLRTGVLQGLERDPQSWTQSNTQRVPLQVLTSGA